MLVRILTLVSPCEIVSPAKQEVAHKSAHICELRELDGSWSHAQVRAYLVRQPWAGAASKYEGIPHSEAVVGERGRKKAGGGAGKEKFKLEVPGVV
tara:strand:- start:848 stop:1135 length:288 start_codon:yes stop_codon:yes gene_type:complete